MRSLDSVGPRCVSCTRAVRLIVDDAAPSSEPDFLECDLECVCLNRQTETLPAASSVRGALACITCRACGRLGRLTLVPALEHPPSIDPDDVT